MTINSGDSHAQAIRYGNIVYLSLSSGSQIGYSAPGMSCLSSLLVFSLPAPAYRSLFPVAFSLFDFCHLSRSLPPSLSLSFSFLASPPFVYHLFERSLFVSLSFSSSFPLFLHPTKYLPLSRLHSGGEASIVIVPHQRRSAINLSPCRAESERCCLSFSFFSKERTTLGIPVAR